MMIIKFKDLSYLSYRRHAKVDVMFGIKSDMVQNR